MHELSKILEVLIILPPNVFQKMLTIDFKTALCVKLELCGMLFFAHFVWNPSSQCKSWQVWELDLTMGNKIVLITRETEEITSFWRAGLAWFICLHCSHYFRNALLCYRAYVSSIPNIFEKDLLQRMGSKGCKTENEWKKRYFLRCSK